MAEEIMRLQGGAGSGFTHQGQSYTADDDGIIEVPLSAVPFAMSHRFVAAPEKKPMPKLAKVEADDGKDKLTLGKQGGK